MLDVIPASDIPADAPRIRSCTLKKWADFQGYGFNLHAEKGKSGHFIGVVDDNSPAETAGVREGDKIIAVNGDSILDASHQQVVSKIKSDPGSVRLLVLDPEAEEYYRTRDIIVTEDMPNVDVRVSPEVSPGMHFRLFQLVTGGEDLCSVVVTWIQCSPLQLPLETMDGV